MKKYLLILIASIGINFYLSAQSVGDYRSIANGNWNDATKWETYNGSTWVSTTNYPGQNPGTGTVTIIGEMEIKLTETVPHPVRSLLIDLAYYYDEYGNETYTYASLSFRSESVITLTVSGDFTNHGQLLIENQNGAKSHILSVGGNFYTGWDFYTIHEDDKLAVIFNTTDPNSRIRSDYIINFQDVTLNGAGITTTSFITIAGKATFINGIIRSHGGNIIVFFDDAIALGASNASFITGAVQKKGDDPFTFPIGAEGVYAPITMSAPVGQTESFTASYGRSTLGGVTDAAISDPGLSSISNCERWYLNYNINNTPTTFNYPLDITIGWTTASSCGALPNYIPNVSEVTIARSYGPSWSSHGGTGTGSPSNGFVTWNALTTVGLFTLGNVGTSCGTPSGLSTTSLNSNSAIINWSAVANALNYDVDYRPALYYEWYQGGRAISSPSLVLSGLSPSAVYEWRVKANCSLGPSSGRQSSFKTLDACNDVYETNNTSSQAKTISLGNTIIAGISSATDVDWFKVITPNSSNTNLHVALSSSAIDYDLYVYNKSLKLIGSYAYAGTSNENVLIWSNLRKATYYIKVIGRNGTYNTSQCYTLLAQALGADSRTATPASVKFSDVTEDPNKQLLYPNPASEFVQLSFNSTVDGQAAVQIFNVAGQLIKQPVIKINKGYNQLKVAVNDIKQGMYLLKINKGELNMVRRFVIAR